jgi:nucleoside-diphosphate-sugar epimerase
MRIFVAGATGALGIPLVQQLVREGHDVTGLTRSETKRALLDDLGAAQVVADALDADALRAAIRRAAPEAVVHALTALPKGGPRRPRDLRATNRLRSMGSRNLLEAAIAAGARRFVAESMMFVYGYGDLGADLIREDRPVASRGAAAWQTEAIRALSIEERSIFEASDADGIEGIVLRFGFFYGVDEGADVILRKIRHRTLPVPRRGVGLQSWIHVRDAAAATLGAIQRGRPGEAYNVVDDQPVRVYEVMDALAQRLGARPPLTVPLRLLRVIAPVLAAGLESSLALSNRKAKDDLGWIPAFSTYREGMREWASRLQEEGSSAARGG